MEIGLDVQDGDGVFAIRLVDEIGIIQIVVLWA